MTPSDFKPIQIIHVTTDSKIGGAEHLLIWIAKYVDQSRYPFVFCTLSKWGPLNDALKQMGHTVFSLDMDSVGAFPKAWIKFRKILADVNPDLVHSHLLTAGLLATFSVRGNIHLHHRHYGNFFKNRGGFLKKLLDRVLVHSAGHLLAVSAAVKDDLVRRLKVPIQRVSVLENAIDLECFDRLRVGVPARSMIQAALAKKRGPYIGMVANFHAGKGHKVLIDSIKDLLKKWPDLLVLFVGEGDGEAVVREYVRNADVEAQVLFCGYVADIAPVMAKFDVLVVPSLSEGFGLVACEAMALKVPVVASGIEGLKEIVVHEQSGLLFENGNSKELSQMICRIFDNADFRQILIKNAYDRVNEKFSMKNYAEKLQKFYEQRSGVHL